jgi:phage portal protein BeeE
MLTAHAVLKGNGYALKITSRGRLLALWPLKNPDRMEVRRIRRPCACLPLAARRRLDPHPRPGRRPAPARPHPRRHQGHRRHRPRPPGAGLSLQAEEAAARTFKQGVIAGLVFTKPGTLSDEAFDRLKAQLEDNNAGAENARKALILEEDLKVDGSLMTAEDLQFLESRGFTRSDIGMFFGVPPHMYGDTEKATSWGTGIEAQQIGFVTYTANDWFVMWEEALERDCLTPEEIAAGYYVRLQRQALLRGDTKTRCAAYTVGLQWGVSAPTRSAPRGHEPPRRRRRLLRPAEHRRLRRSAAPGGPMRIPPNDPPTVERRSGP